MSFRNDYPEYATIEVHIARARAERSVAIAHMIAHAVEAAIRGLRKLVGSAGSTMEAEHRKALAADAFLRRHVPKY